MFHLKLFGVLIMLAAIGTGAVVISIAFFGNTTVVNTKNLTTVPSADWLKKHYLSTQQAAQSSADKTIRQDCAAIRKLGATNPNCPSQ